MITPPIAIKIFFVLKDYNHLLRLPILYLTYGKVREWLQKN